MVVKDLLSARLYCERKYGSLQWTEKQNQQYLICILCAANTPPHCARELLKMSELPETKWTNLSEDFYGPLQTGEILLVIIDEYSRFQAVKIVYFTSASNSVGQ